MVLFVTNLVIPDDVRLLDLYGDAPLTTFTLNEINLGVIVRQPLFNISTLICATLALDGVQGEIGRDRNLDRIVVADHGNTPVEILAYTVVQLGVKD